MAQINLLGTHAPKVQYSSLISSFIVKGLGIILALLLLYYGYLVLAAGQQKKTITTLEEEVATIEQQFNNNQQKNQLFTRQTQLKDLELLLKRHVYWSGIIGELSRVTLKASSYSSFTVTDEGSIQASVEVPNYVELDKFLQVFDLPQFNKQVSNVKIRSITKVQRENALSISAKIEFNYNADSLRK